MPRRLLLFLFSLLLGLGLGLAYAWWADPVRYSDDSLTSLKPAYQADYVQMVADAFQDDGNLLLAGERLAKLGIDSPTTYVQKAIVQVNALGVTPEELHSLAALNLALQTSPLIENEQQP